MLTLSVKNGEHIRIGDAIVFLTINGRNIKVAIDAPLSVSVERQGAVKKTRQLAEGDAE